MHTHIHCFVETKDFDYCATNSAPPFCKLQILNNLLILSFFLPCFGKTYLPNGYIFKLIYEFDF